jgi:DNA relaxase NicK
MRLGLRIDLALDRFVGKYSTREATRPAQSQR